MPVTESGVDVVSAFALHRVSLIRLATLLLDDPATAEDVVQDAFVSLHRHRGELREPQALYGYLRKAVINNARNTWRHRAVVRRALPVYVPDAGPADERLLMAEESDSVLTGVRALPRRQREVLVLRYWSGLSEAQIAETLGISTGAVKKHANRALNKLQTTLGASS